MLLDAFPAWPDAPRSSPRAPSTPAPAPRSSSSARTCSAPAPSSSAAPTTRCRASLPTNARRGVVAFSSGNHAQAVALAGQLLDIPRVIVMPSDAPAVKRAATAGYGAEVVAYDREREDREAIGRRLADERGLTRHSALRSPARHRRTGHGRARADRRRRAARPAARARAAAAACSPARRCRRARSSPGCRVIGVEPAAGDDATRSFRTKTLQTVNNPTTVADGARTPSLGTLTFPLVLSLRLRHDDGRRRRPAANDVLPVGTAEARRRADRRARRGGAPRRPARRSRARASASS